MSATAVIPARYASTRFPGKALADRTGKPLIQHVVEQVRKAELIDRVIVATDDQRIYDAAVGFGCEAMLTRPDHPNGTSRIAEVAAALSLPDESIIVNVQGDEPEIDPRVIDQLVHGLEADGDAPMATLASDFADVATAIAPMKSTRPAAKEIRASNASGSRGWATACSTAAA